MRRDSKSKLEAILWGLLWSFFYYFRYSSQEKVVNFSAILIVLIYFGCSSQEQVQDVSAIIIVFSIAFGTQVKRKWRRSQLSSYLFCHFVYLNQEKVEDVSAIIILVLSLCESKSRKSVGRLSYHHTSLLLCVLKWREEHVDGVSAITIMFQTCSITFGCSS